MSRMENVTTGPMDIWAQTGGAIATPVANADDHQGDEMQSAMLTRSPQTCYSIDQEMANGQYSGHFPFCIEHEIQAAQYSQQFPVCIDQGQELQSAMLTRSPQTCYSIGQ
ncbi:hypothetical protein ACTU44_03185 [Thalassospira sp. SM2505]